MYRLDLIPGIESVENAIPSLRHVHHPSLYCFIYRRWLKIVHTFSAGKGNDSNQNKTQIDLLDLSLYKF